MIETLINYTMTDSFINVFIWISAALTAGVVSVPIVVWKIEEASEKKMIEKKSSQKELEKKSIKIPNNLYDFFIGLDKLNSDDVIKNEEYNYLKKQLTPKETPNQENKLVQSKKKNILSLLANKLEIDFYRESDLEYISTNRSKFSILNIKNNYPTNYQSSANYLFVVNLFKELEKERMFFNIPKLDIKIDKEIVKKTRFTFRENPSTYSYAQIVDFLLTPIDFSQHIDEYKELLNIEKSINNLKKELKLYLNKNGDDEETIQLTENKIHEGEEKGLAIIDELNKYYPFDKNYFEKSEEYITMIDAKNEQTLSLFNKANTVSFD